MTRFPDSIVARMRRPGSPTHLAVVRIVFALHVLIVLTSPSLPISVELGVDPLFLTNTMVPATVEQWTARASHLDALIALGVAAAVAMMLGLLTRLAVPLVLVVFALTQNHFFRRSLFHDDWLYFNFYLLVLWFAPCADRLAVDRWLFRKRERQPHEYRWPVEVMIGWFVSIYLAAALAKLFPLRKGVAWLQGAPLQHLAQYFLLDSPIYWVLHRPLFDYGVRWPFCVAAVGAVVIELATALVLLTTRFDGWVVGAILFLHGAIWLLGIPGFIQIALVSAVLFLRPRRTG
jgi:hypothetical protein